MNKRQWIWLIIALVLFIVMGVLSVAMNTWRAQQSNDLLESFSSVGEMSSFPLTEFIARVDIEGTITSGGAVSALYGSEFNEEYILDYIDRLIDCPQNVGILLYIDSGGGEMLASDEVYLKLMDYKEETGRPIYCYFDGTACSGAYYIAMAADEIWANRNCICVNIGVYIETYNLTELFEKYGIEEIAIKSSENKGIGMYGQPWTEEQLAIYQSIVDLYYEQFLEVVATGRGMTTAQVRQLDDGREMLASQALDAGFIDGISRYEEYETQVLGNYGEDMIFYEETVSGNDMFSILDFIYGRIASLIPVSEGQMLRDFVTEHNGIVVMAYAG